MKPRTGASAGMLFLPSCLQLARPPQLGLRADVFLIALTLPTPFPVSPFCYQHEFSAPEVMAHALLACEHCESSGLVHQHLLERVVGTRVLWGGKKYTRPALTKSQADTAKDKSDYLLFFSMLSPCTQLPRNSTNVFIFLFQPC